MSTSLAGTKFQAHRELLQLFKTHPSRSSVELAEQFPNHAEIIHDLNNVGIRITSTRIGRLTIYKLSRVMEGKL